MKGFRIFSLLLLVVFSAVALSAAKTAAQSGEADLIVSSLTGPASACVGEALGTSIDLDIKNIGSADTVATGGYFYTDLVLSIDGVFGNGDDILLIGGRDEVRDVVAAGGTLTMTLAGTNTVPVGTAPGTYYLLAKVDSAASRVAESDESNNTGDHYPIEIEDCAKRAGWVYSTKADAAAAAWIWDGDGPRRAIAHADLGLSGDDDIDALSLGDDPLFFAAFRHAFFGVDGVGLAGSDLAARAAAGKTVQRDLYVQDSSGAGNALCLADLVAQSGGDAGEVIDAFDFGDHGLLAGDWVYFSLASGSPTLTVNGWSAGDVLVAPYGAGAAPTRYAKAADLGLDPDEDDIDALSIHDHAFDDAFNTAADYVIYSVAGAPGVFHYGFGAPASPGGQAHDHAGFGLADTDEIEALEYKALPCCGFGQAGDVDGDGVIGIQDVVYGLQVLSGARDNP